MSDYKEVFEFSEIFKGYKYAIFINSKPIQPETNLDRIESTLNTLQKNMTTSFQESRGFSKEEFASIKAAHEETK